jgi:hypothetical protein
MTLNTLLTFLVISQIAMAAYLLYSFNTIERASRRRHEALAAHVDAALARLEERLTGNVRARVRPELTSAVIPDVGETELLRPREA